MSIELHHRTVIRQTWFSGDECKQGVDVEKRSCCTSKFLNSSDGRPIMACMWFCEVCSCCCLPLPTPASICIQHSHNHVQAINGCPVHNIIAYFKYNLSLQYSRFDCRRKWPPVGGDFRRQTKRETCRQLFVVSKGKTQEMDS